MPLNATPPSPFKVLVVFGMLGISPNLLFIFTVSLLNSSCSLFLLGVDLEFLSYTISSLEEGMVIV